MSWVFRSKGVGKHEIKVCPLHKRLHSRGTGVSETLQGARGAKWGNSVRIYLDPAWKCREASWPRARSSELTDQAVTIRGSSWLRPSQSLQMLPGSPPRAAFHTDGGCLQQSGRVGDNFGGRVSSSCWQACPLLCACRVICAVSPGKGAELQVHVHRGARW